jgi:MFS family permease
MIAPFRSLSFRRLWYSTIASSAATGLERTLIAWLALQIGADAFAVGLIFAVRMLPSLLFGLAAGTLADRADRPRQLLVVAIAAGIVTLVFSWMVFTLELHVWQLIVFGFVISVIQVFDIPARQALVLDTAPADAAQRALALSALAYRIAIAIGSFLGGILIAQFGIAAGYLAAVVCYAAVALFTASLRVPQEHRAISTAVPFRTALADSLRMIGQIPMLRTLVIVGVICEIFAFSHSTALPLFAKEVLQAGPTGLGILTAAISIGGAIAVALVSALPERIPRQPLLGVVFVVYGLALMALAATQQFIVAVLIALVVGCCAAAFDVLQQTLIQLAVPAEQRGRAVGIWVLTLGSAPVGHLEMGALAAALGAAAALGINGALTLASAVLLLLIDPGYRWLPRSQPKKQ